MRSAFFLLLRLICYPALALMLAAGAALAIVWVNGQCPPFDELGVTCATRFSQALADFGLAVAAFSALTGIPIIPALGGVVLMVFDIYRRSRQRSADQPKAQPQP
jgi:hypothetical protein